MNELAAFLVSMGLTPVGFIVSALNFSVIVWWIRGMAERKRAETEKDLAEAKLVENQYDRLVREVARLDARVAMLEQTVSIKDAAIADLTADKLRSLAERAAERVLTAALEAELKHTISSLEMKIQKSQEISLINATEHVAAATDRVADAAEKAVIGKDKI